MQKWTRLRWRLSKALGTTPELRLNMQQAYDLWEARQKAGSPHVQIMRKPDEHLAAGVKSTLQLSDHLPVGLFPSFEAPLVVESRKG